MPFGSSSPIAVNGALFQAGWMLGGLYAEAGNPTRGTFGVFAGTRSFIRPGNGEIIYIRNANANGSNIAVAGPSADGRDQLAAFPNNSLVHFYQISDGFITNGISSLSPPFATPPLSVELTRNIATMLLGPALPTGFVYWSYMGCIPMNGANLHFGQYDGNHFNFIAPQNLVNSAAAGATFNVLAAMRNAYGIGNITLNLRDSLTTNAGGAASSDLLIASDAGFIIGAGNIFNMPISVPVATGDAENAAQIIAPFASFPAMGGADFSFQWVNDVNPGNIAARNVTVDIAAFRCAFSLKD